MNIDITDRGAVPGGKVLSTAEIQRAIDDCNASGGGRVTVPPGVFLTGTIWLRDNVELHLEHGSVLKASADMNDYNALDAYPQNYGCDAEMWVGKHLIIAHETTGTAITGTGTIDGSGDAFYGEPDIRPRYYWKDGLALAKDPKVMRPGQLVCFIECDDVTVRDVKLTNMPCWGLFLLGCENVTIQGLRVFNDKTHANTDGIDIDTCRHVTVSDCVIDTGDDAIAIRGCAHRVIKKKITACEYVTITNCTLASSACLFRVGVGQGTIRHVRASNLTLERGEAGMCFQTDFDGHGRVNIEDVNFSGVSAYGVSYPVIIWEGNGANVRDITIENYRAWCMGSLRMNAAHRDTVSGITLRNCDFRIIDSPFEMTENVKNMRGRYLCEASNINELIFENLRILCDEERAKLWDGGARIMNCTGKYGFEGETI